MAKTSAKGAKRRRLHRQLATRPNIIVIGLSQRVGSVGCHAASLAFAAMAKTSGKSMLHQVLQLPDDDRLKLGESMRVMLASVSEALSAEVAFLATEQNGNEVQSRNERLLRVSQLLAKIVRPEMRNGALDIVARLRASDSSLRLALLFVADQQIAVCARTHRLVAQGERPCHPDRRRHKLFNRLLGRPCPACQDQTAAAHLVEQTLKVVQLACRYGASMQCPGEKAVSRQDLIGAIREALSADYGDIPHAPGALGNIRHMARQIEEANERDRQIMESGVA